MKKDKKMYKLSLFLTMTLASMIISPAVYSITENPTVGNKIDTADHSEDRYSIKNSSDIMSTIDSTSNFTDSTSKLDEKNNRDEESSKTKDSIIRNSNQNNVLAKSSAELNSDPSKWTSEDGNTFLNDWDYEVWNGTYGGRYLLLKNYKGTNPNLVIPGYLNSRHGGLAVLMKGIGKSSPYYFLKNTNKSLLKSIRFVAVNNNKVGVITGQSGADSMFEEATNLETADLSGLIFSNIPNRNFTGITNCSKLFNNCSKLRSVTLPVCNTVTDCSYMFNNCSQLDSINKTRDGWNEFQNFDTQNVKNMSYMFANTRISSFPDHLNYSNVTDLSHMFENCVSLRRASSDGSVQLDMPKALDMSYMFASCRSLTGSPNISSSTVKNVSYMFANCVSLQYLAANLTGATNITDMSYMFTNCTNLSNINMRYFNTSNVTNMSYMFSGCAALTDVVPTNMNTSKVTTMAGMFKNCKNLLNPNFSNLDFSNVVDMSDMFNGCTSLTDNFVSNMSMINTTNVQNMAYMFANCTNLKDIRTRFNTSNATNMDHMFYACTNLVTADLSNFNTSKVTNMSYMFGGDSSLQNINVRSFNTSKVTNMAYMFGKTDNLRYIDLSSFNTSSISNVLMTTLFFTENKTPLLVIVDKNHSSQLFSYNYSGDNRVPVIYPQLDANGGTFNGKNSTLSYFNNIVYDKSDSKLLFSSFESWKNNNIPSKSNTVFVRWHSAKNSTTLEQMVKNSTVFKAEWILNPNTTAENTKNASLNTLAIVYFPTQFTTGQNQISLNDKGQQVIPFSKGNLTSVGIRDQRMSRSNWKLNARMSWNGEGPNGGGYIKLGENATVKQNNNNGDAPFNSISDLVSTSQLTVGSRIINSNDSTIMTNNSSSLDGVYECDLGDVSLVLSEVSQVAVGNYSAKVTWNLILAPS